MSQRLGKTAEDPFAPFSVLQQLTMWWARPFLVPTSQVHFAYVSSLPQSVDIQYHADRLSEAWILEEQRANPSFYRALIRAFWKLFVWYMLPYFLMACGQLGVVVAFNFLVRDLRGSSSTCYILAAVYSVAVFLTVLTGNVGLLKSRVLGAIMRDSISIVLYEKALTLTNKSASETSAKLTHLIGSITGVLTLLSAVMFLFITPFFVVISTPVIWYFVGVAGLIAEVAVLLIAPIKWLMAKCLGILKKNATQFTESRIPLTESLIKDIKSVKMYEMEPQLLAQIEALKGQEHKQHQYINIMYNLTTTLLIAGGLVVMLVLLLTMVGLDDQMNPADIFGAMSILFLINTWINENVTTGLDIMTWVSQITGSITEIMKTPSDSEKRTFFPPNHPTAIHCDNVSAAWDSSDRVEVHPNESDENDESDEEGETVEGLLVHKTATKNVLEGVEVEVEAGKLCVVIGNVGSGKSSFLALLAGVLKCSVGSVHINKSVAYVENDAWIVPGTVKENITLGQKFNQELYEKVLEMCSLKTDLEQFPQGDMTLIGDKGSTLSGGQKTRIALARAVYQDKEVYLLDDPLSAVDAHVSAHIFNRCIVEGLTGKTRILVTNQHSVLPQADLLLIFREGRLIRVGTYEDIKRSAEFQAEIAEILKSPVSSSAVQPSSSSEKDACEYVARPVEEAEDGSAPVDMYLNYFLLFFKSRWVLLGLAIVIGCAYVLYVGALYWVSHWTAQDQSEEHESIYPEMLIGIVGGVILVSLLGNALLLGGMAKSNLILHNQALKGVTHTNLSFFDVNPVGRILSRFTKDCWVMEELFLKSYSDQLVFLCFLLSYLLAMVVTLPLNVPGLAVACFLVVLTIRRFVPPTRQFKRVEMRIKDKMMEHLGTSIGGLTTIRNSQLGPFFQGKFTQLVSCFFENEFCFSGNLFTLQLILKLYGTLFVTLNAFASVLLRNSLSVSVVAVNFSLAVMINSTLGSYIHIYVNTGCFMLSGHRLYEYTQLPREKDPYFEVPLRITQGNVEFKTVDLRYGQDLPLALNHISFHIPGGANVALLGRTGSGKSSITQALFRLREVCGGAIMIDGQDISKVGLQSLRSQISAIPQSPLILQGSVVDNLTSFGTFSESEAEEVLKEVGLEARGTASELSSGQKQLLCLARAFLKKSQVVLFDEPTGNIDPNTQDFVLMQVKKHFATQTVIIIAHRLQVALECDSVLVLEGGRVVEVGRPAALAQTEGSRFQALLKASGLSA